MMGATNEFGSFLYTNCHPRFHQASGNATSGNIWGTGGKDLTSDWQVIFDTETTTCPAQKLRVGFAQIRKAGMLIKEVAFHRGDLSGADFEVLRCFCAANDMELISVEDFRKKVLLDICYRGNGTLIGFNLPFDISRIALDWGKLAAICEAGSVLR